MSALVVLTLTGFSTGRHGGSSGDGGGGGGCSSSSQNHDSSTSGGGSHRDDDDYDSDYDYDQNGSGGSGSGSGSSSSLQDATVELVSCASKTVPHATVEVTNPNAVAGTFTVSVRFQDSKGSLISSRTEQVEVPGADTTTVQVDVGVAAKSAALVARCDLTPVAPAAR
ncbi:hypothetical protein ACIHFC_20800 [Streptomyces sp. NPDC052013]|uniref:hypothetical protein n=1 Tax=Streptomyces sp. NPDC052013 TaxID=3365679 RepID=UPI0037D600CA